MLLKREYTYMYLYILIKYIYIYIYILQDCYKLFLKSRLIREKKETSILLIGLRAISSAFRKKSHPFGQIQLSRAKIASDFSFARGDQTAAIHAGGGNRLSSWSPTRIARGDDSQRDWDRGSASRTFGLS